MKRWLEVTIALVGTAFISTVASAGAGPKGHHETFSTGEPGDRKKPARIV